MVHRPCIAIRTLTMLIPTLLSGPALNHVGSNARYSPCVLACAMNQLAVSQ